MDETRARACASAAAAPHEAVTLRQSTWFGRGVLRAPAKVRLFYYYYYYFFLSLLLFAFSVIDVTPRRPREGRPVRARRPAFYYRGKNTRRPRRSRGQSCRQETRRNREIGRRTERDRVRWGKKKRCDFPSSRATRGWRFVFAIEFADNRVRITAPKLSFCVLT